VIEEWDVPWENTRPRDPDVHASGAIWFVGQRGNYLGVLDPVSGEVSRYDLPERALPHNIVAGPEGDLWYAGNGDSHIGRIDPETGDVIRRYPMPEGVRDPHTLAFAPDGRLWFTAQGANRVGRLDPSTGEVEIVTPERDRSRPYGIVVDESGTPWIALFGTNRIASIDPRTLEMQEHELPWADARPRRLARTSDGMIWYVDYARGSLGRLDPSTGDVREWPAPAGAESRPYAMTVDDRDRLWFVETGPEPNVLVGFDPATGEYFERLIIPSGGGAVRHMVFHAPTRSIWFGTDANTIGRAILP
jgi:virginiamycin B lyase